MKYKNINPLVSIVLIVVLTIVSSCKSKDVIKTDSPKVEQPESAFGFVNENNISSVLDLAKEKDKGVFVYLYFDKCPPCKLMEEYVFSDQELGTYFKKNFINYKVDTETTDGADLATIFNVYSYPSILFLNDKGQVLEQINGRAVYQEELKYTAQIALLQQQ